MSLDAGTRVGPYKLISQLGSGGMGEVYLALDTRLGRNVALKFLSTDFTESEERVRRFQQEARAASKLNHPNLITIFDVGQMEATHFIATEFIEGETLRERMLRGHMSFAEICDIAIQVSNALAIAHSAGIMHRDIKPENIMIRPDGLVKVLDFGLAKLTEKADQQSESRVDPSAPTKQVNTEFGMVMGTITYMSPEQARGVKVDFRTDVFSLGVVMYEMISGRVPFQGATYSDVIAAIISKKPSTLTRYQPEIPTELERIVNKALAKNRDDRYQTIRDLLIDLKNLRPQLDEQSEADEPSLSDSESSRRASGGNGQAAAPARKTDAKTQEIASVRGASSAEYIVNSIRRHKKGAMIMMAALIVAVVGVFYFVSRPRPIKSLAVVPSIRMTDDQNTRSLTEAMTRQLINDLSGMPGVSVKSFGLVMRFMDEPVDPLKAGRDLDVGTVLMVRVVKPEQGDKHSFTVELINARDASTIWGGQFDRKFAELRGVEQEVLNTIAAKLDVRFTDEEKRLREAERFYQEGRILWEKRTGDALRQAITSFDKAIEMNPNYAEAFAGKADCYNMLATYGAESPKKAFPEARRAAEQALRINQDLAEAHTSLGFALYRGDWNWTDARYRFERAVQLKADHAQARQWFANYWVSRGCFQKAEEEAREAQKLDPTSPIIRSHFGLVYFFARRYDDAITASNEVLALAPEFFAVRRYLGWAYEQKGMFKESIEAFRLAVKGANNSMLMKAELAHALASSGDAANRAEAEALLKEMIEAMNQRYISAYHVALIQKALGDTDEAFKWLERAIEEKGDYLAYLNVDPRFDRLRPDARFQELARKINFPPSPCS